MDTKKEKLNFRDKEAFLTFLKRTKEGKYAKINKDALAYSRIKEQREEPYYEEEYYYSLS